MTNMEHNVALWHEKTYGPRVDLPGTCRKLSEEVAELFEAIARQDEAGMREESGDVLFTLTHIIRAVWGEEQTLTKVLGLTLNKVKARRNSI